MISAEEKNSENNTYDEYHTEFIISSITFIKLIMPTIMPELIILRYTDLIVSNNKIIYFCGLFLWCFVLKKNINQSCFDRWTTQFCNRMENFKNWIADKRWVEPRRIDVIAEGSIKD